ncbi:MAG: nickel pincer cofactor biosynthesis protein LarB [Candidatus Sumerlaeaceae bacterium]
MKQTEIRGVLDKVASGSLSPEQAEQALALLQSSFVDLGAIKLDTDRKRRRGVSEAIYCEGKTPEQVLEIVVRLGALGQTVICTRIDAETAAFVRSSCPDLSYYASARVLARGNEAVVPGHGYVAVVTAGTTDVPVAEEAAVCLEVWGNEVRRVYDVGVAGIQRLFSHLETLQSATVLVVVAGMEAALPSVVAGLVRGTVIAVPTSVGYGASLGGITALLGMLNSCSGGIATVNIDNGFGAGLLAHMINHTGIAAAKPAPGGTAA